MPLPSLRRSMLLCVKCVLADCACRMCTHPRAQLPNLIMLSTALPHKVCMVIPLLQAMVPMWDALNHVTGRANIRLHHCERSGSLQMIATQDIAQVCSTRLCVSVGSFMQPILFAGQRASRARHSGAPK